MNDSEKVKCACGSVDYSLHEVRLPFTPTAQEVRCAKCEMVIGRLIAQYPITPMSQRHKRPKDEQE